MWQGFTFCAGSWAIQPWKPARNSDARPHNKIHSLTVYHPTATKAQCLVAVFISFAPLGVKLEKEANMFVFRNGRFVFAPDHKDTSAPVTEPTQETNQDATPAGAKNTDTGAPAEHMVPKSRLDQLNNELKALRAEQAQAQKERDEAARKAAEEQGKFKELYEGAQTQVTTLAPKAELADKLAEMVAAQLKAEVDGWPEEVKAVLPTDPTDILAFMDAVGKARPLAQKLSTAPTPPPAGNGRGPKPAGPKAKPAPAPVIDVKRTF